MWTRLRVFYARRVVNVNVNIVAAGILALLPTLLAVHLVEHWLGHETRVGAGLKLRLEAHHKLVISAVTFLVDVCSDVCFYYALHFVANHWPRALKYRPADAQHTQVPFFKDATIVQFQRMILSPLLYTIWLGSQQVLMQAFDVSSVWATAIGCIIAVGTIRIIHTYWMIKAARKAMEQGAKILHELDPRVWVEHLHGHPHGKPESECRIPPPPAGEQTPLTARASEPGTNGAARETSKPGKPLNPGA